MKLSERLASLGIILAGWMPGWLGAYKLAADWLHFSNWLAIPIAAVGGTLSTLMGLIIVQVMYDGPRDAKRRAEEKSRDQAAIEAWQRQHTDPVLGVPSFYGSPIMDGKWSERLAAFEGRVVINPPERLPNRFGLFAHIGPQGFTQAQREFYRRVLLHHCAMIESFLPALKADLHSKGGLASGAEFPDTISIDSLEIGPMNGDQLGESILTLEYSQDEYVNIGITADQITSIHFFM